MQDYNKQKFLDDWQLNWWIKKHKAFLYFTLIITIIGYILSGFGN